MKRIAWSVFLIVLIVAAVRVFNYRSSSGPAPAAQPPPDPPRATPAAESTNSGPRMMLRAGVRADVPPPRIVSEGANVIMRGQMQAMDCELVDREFRRLFDTRRVVNLCIGGPLAQSVSTRVPFVNVCTMQNGRFRLSQGEQLLLVLQTGSDTRWNDDQFVVFTRDVRGDSSEYQMPEAVGRIRCFYFGEDQFNEDRDVYLPIYVQIIRRYDNSVPVISMVNGSCNVDIRSDAGTATHGEVSARRTLHSYVLLPVMQAAGRSWPQAEVVRRHGRSLHFPSTERRYGILLWQESDGVWHGAGEWRGFEQRGSLVHECDDSWRRVRLLYYSVQALQERALRDPSSRQGLPGLQPEAEQVIDLPN